MIFSPTFLQFRRLRFPLNANAITLCLCAFCVFATSFACFSAPAFAQVSKKSAVNASSASSKNDDLSEISKFVNDKTLMVVRIDLDRVDYARFGETLEELFKITTKKLDFDQDSTAACLAEFHKTVEELKSAFQERVANPLKEEGISKVYYVLQSTKNEGECFIVPLKGLSNEQIEKVKRHIDDKAGSSFHSAVYQKDHLLSSTTPLKELGAYYKNFKPSPNPQLEKFFKNHSDKVLAFYCGRVMIRAYVSAQMAKTANFDEDDEEAALARNAANASAKISAAHGTGRVQVAEGEARIAFLQGGVFGKLTKNRKVDDPFEDSPRCIKDMIEVFDSSFTEAYGYVDLSTLRLSASLKFSSPVNAGKFRDNFARSLDELIPVYFNNLATINGWTQDMIDGKHVDPSVPQSALFRYRLLPVLQELLRGNAQIVLVPRQNASELIFELDVASELQKVGPYTIGFTTFMTLLNNFSKEISEVREEIDENNPFDEFLFDESETPSETTVGVETEAPAKEPTTETAPAADGASDDKTNDAKTINENKSESVDSKETSTSEPEKK